MTVHYVFPVMRPGVKKMINGDIGETKQEARQLWMAGPRAMSRAGFGRDRVIRHTSKSRVQMQASSRLKPVPLQQRVQSVRTDMNADVGPA